MENSTNLHIEQISQYNKIVLHILQAILIPMM